MQFDVYLILRNGSMIPAVMDDGNVVISCRRKRRGKSLKLIAVKAEVAEALERQNVVIGSSIQHILVPYAPYMY